MGFGPDHHEERCCAEGVALVRTQVAHDHLLEGEVALQLADLAVAPDVHSWGRPDPLGEISRHVPVQVVVADHEIDVSGVPGQEQGGLSGGVPATQDGDRVTAAEPCLELGGRVVDAGSLEPVHAGDLEAAVPHAGREHHGVCLHLGPVGQPHDEVTVDAVERPGLAGDGERGTELAGLDDGSVGELGARDTGREAEVVLDLGRRPCLPSCRDGVEHDRGESFGRRARCGSASRERVLLEEAGPLWLADGQATLQREPESSPATLAASRAVQRDLGWGWSTSTSSDSRESR